MVLFTASRGNNFVGGTCGPSSALLVIIIIIIIINLIIFNKWCLQFMFNKCIGDDTIAAAATRQSQTALKTKKYGEKRFSIWWMDSMEFLHPAMWHGSLESWVNSPSGSTLQCDTWLWDDMPLNEFAQTSAISELEFYIWFPFPHIIAVDMSFSTSLRNFSQIGPLSTENMTSFLRYVDF